MALTAMACVGASSATAESTALCGSDVATCSSPISHVHEASVGKVKLVTTAFTVECDALFLGDALSALANPLVIHGNYTDTNCNSCTEEAEIKTSTPPELTLLRLGHETADATLSVLIHVVCSVFDCYYNGVALKGTGKGPLLATQANGEISLVKQKMVKEPPSTIFCPSSAQLDITTTPLAATYITS